MNKTKKLTQGAMLLAIIGALMLIDRQLSYLFTEMIVLMVPVVIAIYSTMYDVKDGGVLCVGLLALTLLFGNLTTYVYMPISIVVGIAVSIAIKKNFDRRKINIVAMVTYIICELIVMCIVSPALGISIASQASAYQESFNEMSSFLGMSEAFSSIIGTGDNFFLVALFAVTIFTGVLEGYMTGFLTIYLLKRLKIKDIGINNILDLKMPVWLSYVLIFITASYYVLRNVPNLYANNEILSYVLLCLSSFSSMVLFYYGYIFLVIYFTVRYGKKSVFMIFLLIIFLFPFSFIIMIVLGFLYGAGPLRNYIEKHIIVNK